MNGKAHGLVATTATITITSFNDQTSSEILIKTHNNML